MAKYPISSKTIIGILDAERAAGGVLLDFPGNDPEKVDPPLRVLKPMGIEAWSEALYSDGNEKLVVVLDGYEQVGEIRPDYGAIRASENPLGWIGASSHLRASGNTTSSLGISPLGWGPTKIP